MIFNNVKNKFYQALSIYKRAAARMGTQGMPVGAAAVLLKYRQNEKI